MDLLLKERAGAFVDCLESFRLELEASRAVGLLGNKEAFCLPPSSASCCSTETFLLGNVVALGTKLPLESGGDDARRLRVFMQTVTSLLELKVSECSVFYAIILCVFCEKRLFACKITVMYITKY